MKSVYTLLNFNLIIIFINFNKFCGKKNIWKCQQVEKCFYDVVNKVNKKNAFYWLAIIIKTTMRLFIIDQNRVDLSSNGGA